jgi:hypothetical protein
MEKNNRKTYALGYNRGLLLGMLTKVKEEKRQAKDSSRHTRPLLDLDDLIRTKRLKHLRYQDGILTVEAEIDKSLQDKEL